MPTLQAKKEAELNQYTIRKVPPHIDEALRTRAKRDNRSLNQVALEALERGLGLQGIAIRNHDLDALAGTWVADPEFDRAIAEMDKVDPEIWR